MKKIVTRAITGSIYVALIVSSLLLESSFLFQIIFPALIILGIWEFLSLIDTDKKISSINKIIDVLGGLILFFSINVKINNTEIGYEIIAPYLGYFLVKNIYYLYLKSENIPMCWAYSFMGQIYVALPLSLLNIIYYCVNPYMLLAIFIFIWIYDTGAYCIGTLMGKHRLYERISPKKSWEGFWGGMILSVMSALCFSIWCNSFFKGPELSAWICLSIVVSVFSTFGDLCESLIKRSLNVKDSGNILPGHGGILDRIDSLLLVVPAALIFFCIINI